MNKKVVDEAIGWIGTLAVVLSYALLSFGVMTSASFSYQAMNGLGALGIIYISFKKKAYQPGVLNIIWLIISAAAIVRILIK